MQEQMPNRTVVAEFFKDGRGIVRANSLTVIREDRGRIHKEIWDVDYSRKFGYILHMSGAGGEISAIRVSGIYHVSGNGNPKIAEQEPQWVDSRDSDPFDDKPRTIAVRKRNRTRRLIKLPKAIDLQPEQDMLDWLQSNGIEGDSVWCSICRDFFPGTDDWDLCNHCWWCDKTGNYSTPDERCDCNGREECDDR